jgi:hypothetical protein
MSRAPLPFQDGTNAGLRSRRVSAPRGDIRAARHAAEARPTGGAHPHGPLPEHQRPQPRPRVRGHARSLSDVGGARRGSRVRFGRSDSAGRPVEHQGSKDPGHPRRDPRPGRRLARPLMDAECYVEAGRRVPAVASRCGTEDGGLRPGVLPGASCPSGGHPRVPGCPAARIVWAGDRRGRRARRHGEARPSAAPRAATRGDDSSWPRHLPGRPARLRGLSSSGRVPVRGSVPFRAESGDRPRRCWSSSHGIDESVRWSG